ISGGGAFRDYEAAVVERVHAGQDFHQRRLSRAVATDQADAVAGRYKPVCVFEEEFVAEAFSGAGKLDHGLELSSHKTRAWMALFTRRKDHHHREHRGRVLLVARLGCGTSVARTGSGFPKFAVELDAF